VSTLQASPYFLDFKKRRNSNIFVHRNLTFKKISHCFAKFKIVWIKKTCFVSTLQALPYFLDFKKRRNYRARTFPFIVILLYSYPYTKPSLSTHKIGMLLWQKRVRIRTSLKQTSNYGRHKQRIGEHTLAHKKIYSYKKSWELCPGVVSSESYQCPDLDPDHRFELFCSLLFSEIFCSTFLIS
jgi:hypothetical protein